MRIWFVAAAAACSTSYNTGAASLSGAPAAAQSAWGGSSGTVLADGGVMLGWGVTLVADPPGTDCFNPAATTVGQISIHTNQLRTASQRLAQIPLAQIPVGGSAPTDGGPWATIEMYGADGGYYPASTGSVTVTAFSAEDIRGSLSVSGSGAGGAFTATGTFDAPSCGKM
jgi:hypothetical protein